MLPGAVRLFPWSRWLPAFVPLLGLLGCSASSAPKTPAAAAKPIFTPPPQLAPTPDLTPEITSTGAAIKDISAQDHDRTDRTSLG